MSNYLDFSVKTRKQLCEWMERSLGAPLIQVELTTDHFNDCIDEAMEEYTKWVVEETAYLGLDLKTYVSGYGFTLPGNVTAVFALEGTVLSEGSTVIGSENTLFSLPNQMWSTPGFSGRGGMQGFSNAGSFITYEAARQFLDLTERMTASEFQFEYNPREQRLVLTPDPTPYKVKGHIAIGVHQIRDDNGHWGESWVKRYALAKAKVKLGTIRAKFGSVSLLATGQIDTSIKEEGLQEVKDLLDEVYRENIIPTFFIG